MKIKKNGEVIRLTESDLKRIVKRTLKESAYAEMEQQDNEIPFKNDVPDQCTESHLKKVMDAISTENDLKFKVQTGADYGINKNFANKILVITDHSGKVCGCEKADFFEGGI